MELSGTLLISLFWLRNLSGMNVLNPFVVLAGRVTSACDQCDVNNFLCGRKAWWRWHAFLNYAPPHEFSQPSASTLSALK